MHLTDKVLYITLQFDIYNWEGSLEGRPLNEELGISDVGTNERQ